MLVCFTGRHNAHSTRVPALEWRIFIESILLIESILYSLLSSQCVTSDRFTLCCVEYLSCVSVLVPLAQQPRRPPCEVDTQYSSPGDVNRGFAGLLKSLLHRDRHFWFYPWCYVQEWRPTSDAWHIYQLLTSYQWHWRRSEAGGCCWLLFLGGSDWSASQANQSSRRQASYMFTRQCVLI